MTEQLTLSLFNLGPESVFLASLLIAPRPDPGTLIRVYK